MIERYRAVFRAPGSLQFCLAGSSCGSHRHVPARAGAAGGHPHRTIRGRWRPHRRLGIAPSLITGFGLVQALVPVAALTEGLAWPVTGLNVGYGTLAALVGGVADRHGAHIAFWLPIGAGLFVAVAATALALRLRRRVAIP